MTSKASSFSNRGLKDRCASARVGGVGRVTEEGRRMTSTSLFLDHAKTVMERCESQSMPTDVLLQIPPYPTVFRAARKEEDWTAGAVGLEETENVGSRL